MQANAGARDYLTTSEVADYLRLKERTVYELVARRQIPCARVTGKLIFPKRLVDRWVEANTEFQDQRLLMPPPIVAGSSDPLLEWALRESGSGLATLFEGSEAGSNASPPARPLRSAFTWPIRMGKATTWRRPNG
jgi:putative molybdopterin biosynthesis protein